MGNPIITHLESDLNCKVFNEAEVLRIIQDDILERYFNPEYIRGKDYEEELLKLGLIKKIEKKE